SIQRIRSLVQQKFGQHPCLFQIKIAQSLYEKRNDVVAIAATGAGKTLSFWMPLLMALEDNQDKMIFVVTPLNILGKQNVELLNAAGIRGIAIDAKSVTDENFKNIEAGMFQVVVINPEILMTDSGHCEKLWKKPSFVSRLLYFVFDEGHCMSEWSSFREQYKYLGSLRFLIPEVIPFYVASATLPTPILDDVTEVLHLRPRHTDHIFRSNNRPDIALCARKMRYSASSFKDLNFLIPKNFTDGDLPPPKFLIFFNSIKEAEATTRHLRSRLPEHLQHKVKYFHSLMSDKYRDDQLEAIKNGDIFGMCVTDSFGMGLDVSDIKIVVQWKLPKNINTLWQRFGRTARGFDVEGFAIFIYEKTYCDDEMKGRQIRKLQRAATKKRK
ncbi:hypothetical protein CERSUDRAFT_21069, partial [Gelatoporia subvermispora B]